MNLADLLAGALIQGLIYTLVSFGVYITYSILDFPDLGVDGTFPLGAAVTAVLLTKGVDPYLTLPLAMAAVIIGISLFRFYEHSPLARALRKHKGLRWLGAPAGTTAVILGSVLYKLCIQTALSLSWFPANMMKFVTAVLFLLVLVVSGRKGEEIIHA